MADTPSPQLEALLEKYKEQLVALILKRIPGCSIYLFGSRARKDYRSGADIDLALDAGKPISFSMLGDLQLDLDDTTIPVAVDFVDLQTATGDFLQNILRDRIVWNK